MAELTVNLDNIEPVSTPPPPPPSYNSTENVNVNVISVNYSSAARPVALATTSPRGQLPTYEEATSEQNIPPPSYGQLFGAVRETRKSSNGVLDFIKNILILLLGTIGCTIVLGFTIIIPICMVVIGTIYLKECPICDYIPVYLLIGGTFGILKQLLSLSVRVRERVDEQELERLRQTPTQTLLNCFMLGWFIIGSYWTYSISPSFEPSAGKFYCHKTLYLFSFYLITSVYVSLAVVSIVLVGFSMFV